MQYEPAVIKPPRQKTTSGHSKQFLFYGFSAALLQRATAVAGPFSNTWYIRDLHFNYFNLSLATCASVLGTMLFLLSAVLRVLIFAAFFTRMPHYETPSTRSSIDIFNQLPGCRTGMGVLRAAFRAFRRI